MNLFSTLIEFENLFRVAITIVISGTLLWIFLNAFDQNPIFFRGTVLWNSVNFFSRVLIGAGLIMLSGALLRTSVIGFLVLIVIAGFTLVRMLIYRRNVLLWSLSAAANRQVPMALVIRSVANERSRLGRQRTAELASELVSGVPLIDALDRSAQLPRDQEIYLRVGEECDAVTPALGLAVSESQADQSFWQSASGKVFYLIILGFVAIYALHFITRLIIPAFKNIFADFDVQLPPLTNAVIKVSYFIVNWNPLFSPIVGLMLIALIYVVLRIFGMRTADLPGAERLFRSSHRSTIFQCLALAVEHEMPLDKTIETIARWHPAGYVRKRLTTVIESIRQGATWQDALGKSNLFSRSDLALIAAAERAGNLSWALSELSDRTKTRAAFRMQATLVAVLPLMVLVFGTLTALFCMGLFLPLVKLTTAIS